MPNRPGDAGGQLFLEQCGPVQDDGQRRSRTVDGCRSREPRDQELSTKGSSQPRWRPDGKELFFIAPGGMMMAASIAASGATFTVATPVALFATHLGGGTYNKQQYAVSRDGRFLLNQQLERSIDAPITLILNLEATE